MTVLAHPDDAEIWAGGTLRTHVLDGGSALCCVLTGAADAVRREEARASARLLGASVEVLDGQDRRLCATPELIACVSELLRTFQPTAVVTHWEDDTHPDHAVAHDIARRAVVATPGMSTSLNWMLACDTYLGQGRNSLFASQLSLDVTGVWNDKVAAIRLHESQQPEHYLASIERQCWLHGARAGTGYAEGFRYIPFYGRARAAVSRLA